MCAPSSGRRGVVEENPGPVTQIRRRVSVIADKVRQSERKGMARGKKPSTFGDLYGASHHPMDAARIVEKVCKLRVTSKIASGQADVNFSS